MIDGGSRMIKKALISYADESTPPLVVDPLVRCHRACRASILV